MRLAILSRRTNRAHRFTFPLRHFAAAIKRAGIDLQVYHEVNERLRGSEVVGVLDLHFARNRVTENSADRQTLLSRIRELGAAIIWFDTSDSTAQTRLDVLPYVDLYAKMQLLRERSIYASQAYGHALYHGRVHANYYHEREGGDPNPTLVRAVASPSDLPKLTLSWNFGLEHPTSRVPSFPVRAFNLFYPPRSKRISSVPPSAYRPIAASFRASLFPRAALPLSHQRRETLRRLRELATKGYRIECEGSVSPRQYWRELSSSIVAPSPFGYGELCFRDFEAFLAGAALLKPDVGHLSTWPDYFDPERTYLPHSWDFDDFEIKLVTLLDSPSRRLEMATAGQERYIDSLSDAGGRAFATHLLSLCERSTARSLAGPN